MTTTHHPRPQVAAEIPAVPLTTEGYSVLHQMMRVRWSAWRALPAAEKSAIAMYVFSLASVAISGAFAYSYDFQFFIGLAIGVVALKRGPVARDARATQALGELQPGSLSSS